MPKKVRTNFDGAWKMALEQFFEPAIAFFRPQIHAAIDWNQPVTFLDDELRQIMRGANVGARRVDKLVEVRLKDGGAQWLLVHVEVQNQFDARFPERMYVYSYRIYDRYRRHAYSLAVLGDESATWQPTQLEAELWDNLHVMRYSVVKLNDYQLQWEVLEQSTNPFAAVVMAHLKTQETRHDPQARYTWKLSFIRRLYHAGYKRKQIEHLLTLIDWFMELPDALEDTLKAEVRKDEERGQMTYITSWERSGIKKGRKQGRKQGWKKGQKKGLQAAIELGLDLNYGADGLALMPPVKQISDPNQLLAIYDALKQRASLEDVRKLIPTG